MRSESPVPAPVEEDQAGERGETLVERAVVRALELRVEVADEAVDVHEIDRAVALQGVGDGDVAAQRVADLGSLRRELALIHRFSAGGQMVVWVGPPGDPVDDSPLRARGGAEASTG